MFFPFLDLALNLNHDLNWIKIKSKIKNDAQEISISFPYLKMLTSPTPSLIISGISSIIEITLEG